MPVIPHYLRQRAPNADDDRLDFIFKDSTWLDETTNSLYRSDDDTAGAAVWTDITPPSNGGGGPCSWTAVTGKPSTFPPSTPIPQASITDLIAALSSKVETNDSRLSDARTPLAHNQAISTITGLQTVLDGKETLSAKGQVNGYAGLGTDGLVPSAQLPASGGNPFTVVKKSSDQTNATTTLANVTGMLVPVLANTDYIIEGFLVMRSSATGTGFKFAFDVPAGALLIAGFYSNVLASTGTVTAGGQRADAVNAGLTSGVDAANAEVMVPACWVLRNGPNAGNAQLMFAAEAAGTVTFRQGSVLRSMVAP